MNTNIADKQRNDVAVRGSVFPSNNEIKENQVAVYNGYEQCPKYMSISMRSADFHGRGTFQSLGI